MARISSFRASGSTRSGPVTSMAPYLCFASQETLSASVAPGTMPLPAPNVIGIISSPLCSPPGDARIFDRREIRPRIFDLHRRRQDVLARVRVLDRVGDQTLHVGIVVRGILLLARAQIDHRPSAAELEAAGEGAAVAVRALQEDVVRPGKVGCAVHLFRQREAPR